VYPSARELGHDPQPEGMGHGRKHRQQLVGGQVGLLELCFTCQSELTGEG
jgi:hypothetical protein